MKVYDGPEGLTLTGVGINYGPDRGDHRAPPDPNAHWDDPGGYTSPKEDEFGIFPSRKINGRHGVVFHASCWNLLEQALRPKAVPLRRLYEICSSLPRSCWTRSVDWGHCFGDLNIVDHQERFPWEQRAKRRVHSDDPKSRKYAVDPWHVAEVNSLFVENARDPPPRTTAELVTTNDHEDPAGSSPQPRRSLPRRDPFAALPPELCADIAEQLSTPDALQARLASKCLSPLFESQHFWASRFSGNHERSWLFEVHTRGSESNESRDWRWLYRRTADSRMGIGLQNRKRIWVLIQHVVDIMSLQPVPPEHCVSRCGLTPNRQASADLSVYRPRAIDSEIPDSFSSKYFEDGCRRLHRQKVYVPERLSRISVSLVRVGITIYVAGLTLASTSGEEVSIGYQATAQHSVETGVVTGCNLAIGTRGIRAIQWITGDGTSCQWLGSPEDCPQTRRLGGSSRPIQAMEVGFDGCKLVSLAFADGDCTTKGEKLTSAPFCLRDSALWYPDLPPSRPFLNQDSFPNRAFFMEGRNPLYWTYFGGPGGVYLRHLTKISCPEYGAANLTFEFDSDRVPAACREFGRRHSAEEPVVQEFPIDGPGGERVDAVALWTEELDERDGPRAGKDDISLAEVFVRASEISTNRGRRCVFPDLSDEDIERESLVKRSVAIIPGTTITGFYGHSQTSDLDSTTAIGIMSEKVELGP